MPIPRVIPVMQHASSHNAVPEHLTTSDARGTLIRTLQGELKRVGCLDVEVTGVWGGVSKKAMGDFLNRVNATLPFDDPDHILLTLLRGYSGDTCGATCPAGQVMTKDRKCWPHTIMAQALKVAPATTKALYASATAKAKAAAGALVLPAPDAPKAAMLVSTPQPIRVAAAATKPLPGRMALGSPVKTASSPPPPAKRQQASVAKPVSKPKPIQVVARVEAKPAKQPPEKVVAITVAANTATRKIAVREASRPSARPTWTQAVFDNGNTSR